MGTENIRVVVDKIRKKFLSQYKVNPELYHQIDVDRVRNDDWQIERFIIDQESEDKAYESLIKALQWKKSFGIHERNDQYFPKEFYESHEIEMYGRDKEGRPIHWDVTKNLVKVPDLTALEQQFIAHRIEKLDVEGSRDGWTLVTDTLGAGLANVNLQMYRFKIDLLQYYPQGMRCVLILDEPIILDSIIKIILSLLSPKLRECVTFIKRNQLPDYIDIDLIHVNQNGKREKKVFPDGLLPMNQLTHLALTDKQIEAYHKKHQMISKRSR